MPPTPHTITTLQTNIPVQHNELEAVKKALGVWLEKEKKCSYHNWIHNHKTGDTPEYEEQNYPLVQLRRPNGRLMLWGMGKGSDVLKELMLTEMFRGFQYRGTQFRILPGETKTETYRLTYTKGKKKQRYELNYFVAFNPKNFNEWKLLPDIAKRMERLQELIINNLAMFCKAADFVLDKEKLNLHIEWLWLSKWVIITGKDKEGEEKKYEVLAFTLTHECNLQLPDGIALGRQTKLGYGWQTRRPKKTS